MNRNKMKIQTELTTLEYMLLKSKLKSKPQAYIMLLLGGGFGLHRFYLGHSLMGTLIVFNFFVILTGLFSKEPIIFLIALPMALILFIDFIMLSGYVDNYNDKIKRKFPY